MVLQKTNRTYMIRERERETETERQRDRDLLSGIDSPSDGG
jgi:hypothetical protein